jgi:hypothetical protein
MLLTSSRFPTGRRVLKGPFSTPTVMKGPFSTSSVTKGHHDDTQRPEGARHGDTAG